MDYLEIKGMVRRSTTTLLPPTVCHIFHVCFTNSLLCTADVAFCQLKTLCLAHSLLLQSHNHIGHWPVFRVSEIALDFQSGNLHVVRLKNSKTDLFASSHTRALAKCAS
jgi:hypothetical protein